MEGEARGVFEVWWDGGRPKLGEPGNEGELSCDVCRVLKAVHQPQPLIGEGRSLTR
jgi:hypothetical protein